MWTGNFSRDLPSDSHRDRRLAVRLPVTGLALAELWCNFFWWSGNPAKARGSSRAAIARSHRRPFQVRSRTRNQETSALLTWTRTSKSRHNKPYSSAMCVVIPLSKFWNDRGQNREDKCCNRPYYLPPKWLSAFPTAKSVCRHLPLSLATPELWTLSVIHVAR